VVEVMLDRRSIDYEGINGGPKRSQLVRLFDAASDVLALHCPMSACSTTAAVLGREEDLSRSCWPMKI
jgi:hypothetical protein